MKSSEKAAPNDRDKSRYGENRQVRASADARKWKSMIENVTQFDAVRRMHREDKENPAGSPKIAAMAAEADGDGAAAESGAESDAAAGHIKQQQPACHVELA